MLRKTIILFIVILLSIFIYNIVDKKDISPISKDVLKIPKSFIIGSVFEIAIIEFDEIKNKYIKKKNLLISDVTNDDKAGFESFVISEKYIYISLFTKLLKVDYNLENLVFFEFKDSLFVSSIIMEPYKDILFICAGGTFYCLNEQLKELDLVDFGLNYQHKNIHDILLFNDTAYLLHNMTMLFNMYQINIQNPKNLIINHKNSFSGLVPQFEFQCINPELNQWIIISSHIPQKLPAQIVQIYSLQNNGELVKEVSLENNYRIEGITRYPPHWAIIYDKGYYYSEVKYENNNISFDNVHPLADYQGDGLGNNVKNIRKLDDLLFILSGKNIKMINIKKDIKEISSNIIGNINLKGSEININFFPSTSFIGVDTLHSLNPIQMGFISRPLGRYEYSSPSGCPVACGGAVHLF